MLCNARCSAAQCPLDCSFFVNISLFSDSSVQDSRHGHSNLPFRSYVIRTDTQQGVTCSQLRTTQFYLKLQGVPLRMITLVNCPPSPSHSTFNSLMMTHWCRNMAHSLLTVHHVCCGVPPAVVSSAVLLHTKHLRCSVSHCQSQSVTLLTDCDCQYWRPAGHQPVWALLQLLTLLGVELRTISEYWTGAGSVQMQSAIRAVLKAAT